MFRRNLSLALFTLLGFSPLSSAHAQNADQNAQTKWHLSGDLCEACTCGVPCPCNFGANPTHPYCYALFSLDIKEGNYGDVSLNGLHLAGAGASKGMILYADDTATKEQQAALKAIAKTLYGKMLKANNIKSAKDAPPDMRLIAFKTTHIEQKADDKSTMLKIGNLGGFDANYIIGLDGKTPVVVENNWSWNIQHGIKAKTKRLVYKDALGNKLDTKETNSNQGQFDWSDTTPIYFR